MVARIASYGSTSDVWPRRGSARRSSPACHPAPALRMTTFISPATYQLSLSAISYQLSAIGYRLSAGANDSAFEQRRPQHVRCEAPRVKRPAAGHAREPDFGGT